MNHHVWTSKQLIVPIALAALAFASAGKAAESSSRLQLDRRTNGVELSALLSGSSEQISGEPQEAAAQPAPQLTPTAAEQTTTKPPRVTYEDGQLTIIAENAALSEVMKALRSALGTDIDLPAGVADQHIWVHLGPGPARRVLRDLLDGTEFNYVIQASENDGDGILSVLLTQRSKSTGPQTPGLPERATNRLPRAGSEPKDATDSDNPPRESVASADSSQSSPPASNANESLAAANLPNPPANSDNSGKGGSVTDQMIQQLQSMYEQRRQLQVQQNQKLPAPKQ